MKSQQILFSEPIRLGGILGIASGFPLQGGLAQQR